jgi:hypothetical protein
VEYNPGIGRIRIDGNILSIDNPKETKKILDEWNKSKKLPPKLMAQLLNFILIRCNIKALSLSQDINLPPHIRMPMVGPVKKETERDYIG